MPRFFKKQLFTNNFEILFLKIMYINSQNIKQIPSKTGK